MGDQVTPLTERYRDLTPGQIDACLADVEKAVAYANVRASGKVRLEPAWTDYRTGERFPASWVAEICVQRAASFIAIVMEVAEHARHPSAWCELLDEELRAAVGRRR